MLQVKKCILQQQQKKIELLRIICSRNFRSGFLGKLHVNMKPFYDPFHDKVELHWKHEPEPFFMHLETSDTKDVSLTLPYIKCPNFIFVKASCIDKRAFSWPKKATLMLYCMNLQLLPQVNTTIHGTLYREFNWLQYSLTMFDFIIIGCAHFIFVFLSKRRSTGFRVGFEEMKTFPILYNA